MSPILLISQQLIQELMSFVKNQVIQQSPFHSNKRSEVSIRIDLQRELPKKKSSISVDAAGMLQYF